MSEKAFYGLPEQVLFCKKCVISNQRPNSVIEFKNADNRKKTIAFDAEGVCDACRYNELKKNIDWKEREKLLFEILEPYRSKDGSYDVIVPSSGGKDSSFAAHTLKYKYGMNPLTVTWAANMYTDVGWQNINSLARIGGVDGVLYTPNGKLHRLLTRNAFLNLGHPFQPFIHGQKVIGPAMAKRFGVKLVMYGENQAEYGNPISDNKRPVMLKDFFSIDDPTEMILGGKKVKDIVREDGFKLGDFSAYIPLDSKAVQDIEVFYLGYFEKWDPQEVYYYSSEHTGFQPAPQRSCGTYSKYTEVDDKIVPFQFYTTLVKFGIGRATYDAAQEIRNGKITREEGVALVEKYDQEFPSHWLGEFLEYIGITEERFYQKLDELRSPHLWRKVDGQWKLRHTVGGRGCDD
jgi:N-acetyl sugar amidotransferase